MVTAKERFSVAGLRHCSNQDGALIYPVVEAKRAIPWTKSEDLTYDAKGPLPPSRI